jgi:poly-gamma-glutamate system protein
MGLRTSLIASVTSSSWGANDPDYTYPDMHSSLIKGGLLKQGIIASSVGGNDDLGKTLSAEGRHLAIAAIDRNNLKVISERSLSESIGKRLALFKRQESLAGPVIAFVNIGGGIASLGSARNSATLPSGVMADIKLRQFPDKQGVMFEMAVRGTKVINFLNINHLFDRYKLPEDPVPLPHPGTGELFYKLKYDYLYVAISLLTLVSALIGVIVLDKKQNAIGKDVIYQNHESVLSDSL